MGGIPQRVSRCFHSAAVGAGGTLRALRVAPHGGAAILKPTPSPALSRAGSDCPEIGTQEKAPLAGGSTQPIGKPR